MDGLLFYLAVGAALAVAHFLGYVYGRHVREETARIEAQRRRYRRRQEDELMADLARISTAVTQILALVRTLKANQADPAEQAALDDLAGQLEAELPPPPPPA